MLKVPEYQINTQIYESKNSIVYRGLRQQDNQPVILKLLRENYPTPEELTRYKQEYRITHDLEIEGVIKAEDLIEYGNSLVIVFEDFGGESLCNLLAHHPFSLTESLHLAIAITQCLSSIHQAGIIHKDINPSNIVYNPQTRQLKIIDFGIATLLSRENTSLKSPTILEGTLAYTSPEQTGRMNRSLDYRTDFYSLGVTLYELVTGKLPFVCDDALELLHCHLAKQPSSIKSDLLPTKEQAVIPIFDRILQKLMAKTAEARYQSAKGIQADLEACLEVLNTSGEINNFILGQQDRSDRFFIPQKLYGRENQIQTLREIFAQVTNDKQEKDSNQLVFVSGYSGIGKSSLVQELFQPITKTKGYYCTGKFDQYQQNIPYSAIIQAFKVLIQQILTESEARLKHWREKLLQVLGVNAQVIIEVIPELELIIGNQPPIADLPPKEAQNRFNLVFPDFINVFPQPDHPLVIFLDDLQWIDSATLKLIQLLLSNPSGSNFLLIGAYRDNEVDQTHPLMLTLSQLADNSDVTINSILLSPLSLSHVNQLLADTLNTAVEKCQDLAKLVIAKTQGNPFFTKEFLRSLYTKKLIKFNPHSNLWQWDIEAIKQQNITENVVELVSDKIKSLSVEIQAILPLAACIGNQFELNLLAQVAHKSPPQTASVLHLAIAQGLIYPVNDHYKAVELNLPIEDNSLVYYQFIHDRIQQAAYNLIPSTDKAPIHYQIGKILCQSISDKQLDDRIFELVNHLNQSIDLISSPSEKDDLVRLNLQASRKAKKSTAYQPAFKYSQTAIALLSEDSWQTQYQLTLDVHNEAVELAYLNYDLELMEKLAATVVKNSDQDLDLLTVYDVKIQAYHSQYQGQKALATTLEFLNLLRFKIPQSPSKIEILQLLLQTKLALWNKNIEDLTNLPPMSDRYAQAISKVTISGSATAYLIAPNLFFFIILKLVNLFLKYGNTKESCIIYSAYSILLCGYLNDVNSGDRFAQVALNLLEKLDTKEYLATTYFAVYNFTHHWKHHIKEILPPLLTAYQTGLSVGDFEYAGYSLSERYYSCFFIGQELNSLEQEMSSYLASLQKINQAMAINYHRQLYQVILNLIGEDEHPYKLIGQIYNEEKMLPIHIEADDQNAIFSLNYFKLYLNYLFVDPSKSLKFIQFAEKYLDSVRGLTIFPLFYFYSSLTYLAIINKQIKLPKKLSYLKRVKSHQQKMKRWAMDAPMNYLHKYYLIAAEKCRVVKQYLQAENYYNRAILGAKEHGYIQEEALANELAGKFYLARNNQTVARAYLKEARYCYLKWGAKAKIQQLEQDYAPWLQEISPSQSPKSIASSTTSGAILAEQLDLATLIKTSQVLSQQADLETLLELLIKFLVENTGAQRGLIFLKQDDNLKLQISYQIEGEKTDHYPEKIINYVDNTHQYLVLDHASQTDLFNNDQYIKENDLKSVLCLPLFNQGRTIGILYLENNLSANIFNQDQLEIVKLISAQSAIAIENAIFRKQEGNNIYSYQVGGCLAANAPSYVIRKADRNLYSALKRGDFCYVFNARHMGKSSLRVRIIEQLKRENYTCVAIDLTAIGSSQIREEQWYAGLIYKIIQSLNLAVSFNFKQWWNNLDLLSPIQKFGEFIEQVLLAKISTPIIIFLDEIDSTLSLPFSTDDFFAMIRSCYNLRADNPEFNRLSFVLLGVTTPANLIQNKQYTPFNLGKAIALSEFKLSDIKPLIKGLAMKYEQSELLAQEILFWTGGQPFLTQKLCNLVINNPAIIPLGQEQEYIANLVQQDIINNWEQKDEPQHFRTIRDRIFQNKNKKSLIQLLIQIIKKTQVPLDYSPVQQELLLSGIVKQKNNYLIIFNPIYQIIFNFTEKV